MAEERSSEASAAGDTAARLLKEWCGLAKSAAEEAEKFVREKPVAGAVCAFVAGWVLSSVFRR